jgi:hypothetical protein
MRNMFGLSRKPLKLNNKCDFNTGADEALKHGIMTISVCPAAQVDAPMEKVWGVLNAPAMYSTWADAVVEDFEPEGKAHAGQVVRLWSKAFGLKWHITMKIKEVDDRNYRISVETHLPFG